MSDFYQYMYTVHNESFDNGMVVSSCWSEENMRWLAQDCAKNFHDHYDGWESSWPMTITIYRLDETKLGSFEVDREAEPVFYAREVK